MHNKKIITEDELSFKIIVKRSDLKKAEDLYNKGILKQVIFDRKDDWANCYTQLTQEKTIEGPNTYWFRIWPTSWGYLGYKDGYSVGADILPILMNRALELGGEIQAMSLNQHSVITEIDEEN